MLERTVKDAPLCTEFVGRSDKLILETFIFIIARVWFVLMPNHQRKQSRSCHHRWNPLESLQSEENRANMPRFYPKCFDKEIEHARISTWDYLKDQQPTIPQSITAQNLGKTTALATTLKKKKTAWQNKSIEGPRMIDRTKC
ncbi:hypothetical protein BDR04DRAFT_838012 [Suillus decipiens]|nr:hypothetical protein BDR04DRAFT_838012 [Suillus decipiens]